MFEEKDINYHIAITKSVDKNIYLSNHRVEIQLNITIID